MNTNICKDITKETVDILFKKETLTPEELIIVKCFDCCAYQVGQKQGWFDESKESVLECKSNCPLNKYLNGGNFGTKRTSNIKRKRNLSEEARQKKAEAMRKINSNK